MFDYNGLLMDGNLNIIQKLEIINSNKVDKELYDFLKTSFNNLKIEICSKEKGDLMTLMSKGKLEGWCWQTTSTAILFLDNAYINRGILKINNKKEYYHSWLVINYKQKDYVFDPCLNILVDKSIYDELFDVKVLSSISSKQVKDFFINYIRNYKKEKSPITDYLRKTIPDYFERTKDEIVVKSNEDVNSPMYRNGVGYKAQIEDNKILSLVAHYYSIA